MVEQHIWEIVTTLISVSILGISKMIYGLAKKGFEELDRNTKLVAMKHDALMSALDSHLKNGIRSAYTDNLLRMMEEHGFVYKK